MLVPGIVGLTLYRGAELEYALPWPPSILAQGFDQSRKLVPGMVGQIVCAVAPTEIKDVTIKVAKRDFISALQELSLRDTI